MNIESFNEFAIVEIFGHQIIAGKVSEQVIAGQGFVRVDVPEVGKEAGYSKLYGPNAIYCITPVDEKTCRAAAEGLKVKPVEVWKLNLPLLEAPKRRSFDSPFADDEEDDEEEMDYDDEYLPEDEDSPAASLDEFSDEEEKEAREKLKEEA